MNRRFGSAWFTREDTFLLGKWLTAVFLCGEDIRHAVRSNVPYLVRLRVVMLTISLQPVIQA